MDIQEKRELFDRAKQTISAYLKDCDSDTAPYVCKMKNTKEGYAELEQFILNLMCLEGYTVGQAIMIKERQLDPSLLNDVL